MADLPTGQISNHYEERYWNLFKIPEKEVADKWDGHSDVDVQNRLFNYNSEYVWYSKESSFVFDWRTRAKV